MIEIKPISITTPILRPAKIKKEDRPPNQQPPKKKRELEEQAPPDTIQHIDEMV
jgi:hypothetical protein